MTENNLRICSLCKQEKLSDEFVKTKRSRRCKECENAKQRAWYAENHKRREFLCLECKKNFAGVGGQKFCSILCRKSHVAIIENLPVSKVCSVCLVEKTLDSFSPAKGVKDRKTSRCKDCSVSQRRNWLKTDAGKAYMLRTREVQKEAARRNTLRRKYGITPKDYSDILSSQDHKCAICKTDNPGAKHGRFQIDHCHKTGRIRGLLCWDCNVGLGKLGDTIESLERAIEYLRGLPTLVI